MIRRLTCLLAMLLVLAGCSLLDSSPGRPLTLTDISQYGNLQFPDGSRLTSSTYQGFQDRYVTAVVEFEADRLADFLTRNGLGEPVAGLRAVTNGDRQERPAWQPDEAVNVLGLNLTSKPDDGVYRRLLFDLDRPDTVVLYLVAFTS